MYPLLLSTRISIYYYITYCLHLLSSLHQLPLFNFSAIRFFVILKFIYYYITYCLQLLSFLHQLPLFNFSAIRFFVILKFIYYYITYCLQLLSSLHRLLWNYNYFRLSIIKYFIGFPGNLYLYSLLLNSHLYLDFINSIYSLIISRPLPLSSLHQLLFYLSAISFFVIIPTNFLFDFNNFRRSCYPLK